MKYFFSALLLAGCGTGPVYIPPYQPVTFTPMNSNLPQQQQMQAPSGPTAFFVRQRSGQSVSGGMPILVCTYQYLGREFERGFQGISCPSQVPVN